MTGSTANELRSTCGPARDQGPRGTCFAFAVTSAHEAHRHCGYNESMALSEEHLYWACKKIDGNGSPGTSPSAAGAALRQHGQAAAYLWPYMSERDDTDPGYQPPTGVTQDGYRRLIDLDPIEPHASAIRAKLDVGLVVVLGIDLWPAFYQPDRDNLTTPDSGDLLGDGHAVAIVGYDDEWGGVLLRNSWGAGWGNLGHAWLAYDALAVASLGAWTIAGSVAR